VLRSRSLLLAVTALSAACKVGPDYQAPALPTPEGWSEAPADGAIATAATGVEERWWRVFADPELDLLIERALASNHDLKIAAARVREARARYGFADAQLLPSLDGSAGAQRDRVAGDGDFARAAKLLQQDRRTTWTAGFDAGWEIDVFGGNARDAEAALADVGAAEADRRATVITLLGEVGRAYVELRGAQRQAAVFRASAQSARDTVELTEKQRASGLATELDLARARTQRADLEAEIPKFEGSARQAMHRLALLLGLPPGALIDELSKETPIPAAPAKVAVGLPSELLRRRPDLARSERRLAAATARVGVATAELYPKFSISTALGLDALDATELVHADSRFLTNAFGFTIPILDAGRRRAKIDEADAKVEAALSSYQRDWLAALSDVEDALVGYTRELERHRSLAEAAQESHRAATLARQLWNGGLATFLDTLDAERVSYQADGRLAESDSAIATRLVQLYKALGGGWDVAEPAVAKTEERE
jgi:multidrug efflux system outer membrane protein